MSERENLDLTVVCPFYNEGALIQKNIVKMLTRLKTLDLTWELIVVNDGSTDESLELARAAAPDEPRLKILSYSKNKGRGHALRTGITAARGDVIVTTEADLSWGEDVVENLYAAMQKWPDADVVVGSPNLDGGGYENVPYKRVLLSRLGNTIIRTFMLDVCTMNTGMTRAYRREVIQTLPLFANQKEFHVEVILKAHALNLTIKEIPAVLTWPPERHASGPKKKGGFFASKLFKFVITHSMMSITGNPTRYIWGLSMIAFVLSMVFLGVAVVNYVLGLISAYTALLAVSLFILALVLFVFGVVLHQGSTVLREIWVMQRQQMMATRRPGGSIYEVAATRVNEPSSQAIEPVAAVAPERPVAPS